jgi:hypothetical protein
MKRLQLLALSGVLAACAVSESKPGSGFEPEPEVAELAIDAQRGVELDPGAGVGVAVEYQGDGRWQIAAACDTNLSGSACHFALLASSPESSSEFGELERIGLEEEDELSLLDPFAVEMDWITEGDLDAAVFTTSPGASVRVSVLLFDPVPDSDDDWTNDPRLLSWVGNGALHVGAPSNPVDLTPASL